jgi:hypothetical protein
MDAALQAAMSIGAPARDLTFLGAPRRHARLGGWSYEIPDTKLARETRGGTDMPEFHPFIQGAPRVLAVETRVLRKGFQLPHSGLAAESG